MLTRSARRHVAARMDDALSLGGPSLKSWEFYLCPPVCGHLLTGDILRHRDGDPDDPQSYVLVLTPSCDLATSETRNPKVSAVLVSCCAPVKRLLSDLKRFS